jgi:photosystem II stability/assembly factor-like uncharacterized protein
MKKLLLAVSFGLCLIFFASNAIAQEFERGESLSKPASSPTTVGFFKELNALPESVRLTSAFARLLHEYKLKAGPDGYIDVDARLASIEQSKADLVRDATASYKSAGSKLPVFADAWQNIGPISSSNPPVSAGCTKALAIDPTNTNIVYAGAAGGGVWKTTNATATTPTWTALTDLVIPDLAVASIAIDPSNPNTIYVGSGDPSIAIDGLGGSGLYRSTNAGSSWSRIAASTFSKTVNKVFVHPTNSDIVFACNYANSNGIYRSTNGGTSFTKVYPTSGFAKGVIWDIIPAQTIAGKLIMYMVEGNNPGGNQAECGVYKSVDDGATWAKISTAGLPSGDEFGKAALAIPKGTLSTVYCFIALPDGNLKGLYRSTNSGAQFSAITVPSTVFKPSGQQGAQGWYDLYLAASPGSASNDTLFIGGVEAYRSFDKGSTWQSYSDYQNHFDIHVDHQSIAIDPVNSKRVWIGTDGGVYRSTDAGQNWVYKSSGMLTMRSYHIALDKSDFKRTFSGFQDQGLWRTYSGQAAYWAGLGDGFQPIVDPTNSNVVYAEQPNGDLVKSTSAGSAGSFNDINPSTSEQTEWDSPFNMAPHNNQTLFSARVRLWRTQNGGSTWAPISNDFYGGSTIEAVGLSPANSNVFWLGYGGGKIQLTTDGGSNWSEKSSGIPSALVRSIVCHPTNADFAVIGLSATSTNSARVMVTTNGGSSWTNVSGTTGHLLPGTTVNCVALDSVNPATTWYAATNNGIYYTLDGGANWGIAGSGIGLASCNDVQVHANKVTIRVGTHGRSIWEANANLLPVELTGLTAIKTSKGTELHWKTDSEINSSGFWVQRSYNYSPFEDLTFVPGAGTSNTVRDYSALDTKTDAGYYIYRLKQVDLDGSEHISNTVDVTYGNMSALRLDQNFPNPFVLQVTATPSTRVRFYLPENEIVSLKIYNSGGAIVKTLISFELRASGEQNVLWDGTDGSGTPVASGEYFYTLETEHDGSMTKKMIVLQQ